MTVSRAVVLLTPVFAALAGYVATQALRLPGAPVLDAGQMTVVFVAGAGAAGGAAVKWLHGRSKHEVQAVGHAQALEMEAMYTDAREAQLAAAPPDVDEQALVAHIVQLIAGVNALTERIDRLEKSSNGRRRVRVKSG